MSDANASREAFGVVDLFSGAGGMSYGFHKHELFRVLAAADLEIGKPSVGSGALQCNKTYCENIGIRPAPLDLAATEPSRLREALGLSPQAKVNVLSTCPPCTGFSRAKPTNHLQDDRKNSLVRRSAEFAVALDVDIVVMENARELIRGNFSHHYRWFSEHLESRGYSVSGQTHMLTRFGLPQVRERAIVIAAKEGIRLRTLEDLWRGWAVKKEALTVRRALECIPEGASGADKYPRFASEAVKRRIAAIPHDGGSWMDLLGRRDGDSLLTDAMRRIAAAKRFGSYPDVYGRMAWGRPAPTIKRECAHVGNGRYAHPEADRLCTVREMGALQGFPGRYRFNGAAISNMYRHIGDAVPPLISFQIAHLCAWMFTGDRPGMTDVLLDGTNVRRGDLVRDKQRELAYG